MEPVIIHRANHDLKINYNIIKGDYKFKDFIKDLNKIVNNPAYIDSYNMLVDIREADFIDFRKKVPIFVHFFQETVMTFNMNRKFSFITTKPMDVVHATILIEKLKKVGIKIKFQIFSSEEAALDWMSVNRN